jgi:hypothetical protein
MNERTDEIAFAAGCHRHKYSDPEHPDLEGFIINHQVLDKFAELIVQECAHIGFNTAYPDKGVDVLTAIKQHFGVE